MPRPLVLVTGAARRIGRAIALDLAGHGFDVAVHWRSSRADADATVADCAAAGATAAAFQADLADEAACRALLPAVAAHFGRRLQAVVNSASTFEYDDPATFSAANMAMHWRANTAPAIILAQALHAHLQVGGGSADANEPTATATTAAPAPATASLQAPAACVVNIVDQKLWNPNPDYFSYTLSKAALQAATVMLAQALAPSVRVCGVAPGVTLASGPMTADEFAAAHRLTPLQRSSEPEDVARAVRFLLESPAITGTTLLVDGGQHLSGQPRDVLYLAQQHPKKE